jgi:hypothetical protein
VFQAGRDARFFDEPSGRVGSGESRGEYLHSDFASEHGVLGAVNNTHPAASQFRP